MGSRLAAYVVSIAVCVVAAMVIFAVSPTERSLGLERVPASDISVFQALQFGLARNPHAVPQSWTLEDYPPGAIAADVQMHIDHANTRTELEQSHFLLPGLDAQARFHVNGMPFAESFENRASGIGLGRRYLSGSVPSRVQLRTTNLVDVALLDATGDQFVPVVLVGAADERDQTVTALDGWTGALRELQVLGSFAGFVLAAVLLAAGQNAGRAALLGALAIATLTVAFAPVAGLPPVFAGWILALAQLGAGAALCISGVRRKGLSFAVIAGLAALCTLSGLASMALLFETRTGDFFLIRTFANAGHLPLLAIGAAILLLMRLHAVIAELAAARAEAMRKSAIIADKDRELHEHIRTSAIMEERQRFVRDMHDGVGGQLLSLLVRLRAGKIGMGDVEAEIEGGLQDLRLVVDSLDRAGDSVAEALTIFESRARQQLQAADIGFEWDVEVEQSSQQLNTRQALNLFRMLQEMLSNTIRHSGAKTFVVKGRETEDGNSLELLVFDDGKGVGDGDTVQGNGLSNIEKRAQQAGMRFERDRNGAAGGCRYRLRIPLETDSEAGGSA